MVDVTGKALPVEFADALKAGFAAAMERVNSLKLDPFDTLVDQIPAEIWAKWDASSENALVSDSAGVDGDDDFADNLDLAA